MLLLSLSLPSAFHITHAHITRAPLWRSECRAPALPSPPPLPARPQVDEVGTEAAAATAVMMLRAALPIQERELDLKFDRPFAFSVLHPASGAALFVGTVEAPEAWGPESAAGGE